MLFWRSHHHRLDAPAFKGLPTMRSGRRASTGARRVEGTIPAFHPVVGNGSLLWGRWAEADARALAPPPVCRSDRSIEPNGEPPFGSQMVGL